MYIQQMFVYMAMADINNWYKLGITSGAPEKRIQAIRAGIPFDLVLVAHSDPLEYPMSTQAEEIERWLLGEYRHCHVKGEWYSFVYHEALKVQAQITNPVLMDNIARLALEYKSQEWFIQQQKKLTAKRAANTFDWNRYFGRAK
jgi:hypothetical protein